MKILMSGASGMIGTALQRVLRQEGHEVNRLIRTTGSKSCCDFLWDPYNEEMDENALEGVEAVIHLSGESIAGRWTESRKQKIRDSRVKSTLFLSKKIAHLEELPSTFICASAIGYYGDRGDEILKENSKFGTGFLANVTREWEAATAPATAKGIRVVNMRIGVVLAKQGGALAKLLTPFKLGAGGIVGNGKQYWSWVSLDDLVGAFHFALMNSMVEGAVNVVAPNPVTNAEFTKILGDVLERPTVVPLPAFAAKMALGEMADALLLSSVRVEPAKLVANGYEFKHSDLRDTLKNILNKS